MLREEGTDLTGNLQTPGCIKSDSFFVWDVTAPLKKNYLRFEGEKHANGMPGFQKSIQQLARASRGAAGNSEAFKDSKDFKKQVYYLDV